MQALAYCGFMFFILKFWQSFTKIAVLSHKAHGSWERFLGHAGALATGHDYHGPPIGFYSTYTHLPAFKRF